MKKTRTAVTLMLAVVLLLSAVAIPSTSPNVAEAQDYSGTIRVSSKQFTEQLILGNLMTIALQEFGYDAQYVQLGSTSAAHEALLADEIDLYAEYTGTAYLTHLGLTYDSSQTAEDIYEAVSEQYAEKWNLDWLQPSKFNNTYCLAMTEARAQELGIKTISDLQAKSDGLVFGATAEFIDRPDGLPGLIDAYGNFNFADVLSFDPGLKYSGLQEGDLDVTTCFGTDGQISAMGLRVLVDDKGFWPPYNVAPVIKTDIVQNDPRIAVILDMLMLRLDGATMSGLNWEVDGNSQEPGDVAFGFLVDSGLIG